MSHQEVRQSYIHTFLRNIATSMISVFVPLRMIELGYPLWQAIFFIIITNVVFAIFSFVSQNLKNIMSVKKTIIAGMLFHLAFYLMIFSLKTEMWNFLLLGIIVGIGDGLYWQSLLTLFGKHTSGKTEGKESGIFISLQSLGGVVAPVVAALIITFVSFEAAAAAAILIYFSSIIPIWLSRDKKIKSPKAWKKILDSETMKVGVLLFVRGIQQASMTIVSIFAFILGLKYIFVGSMFGLASLCFVAINYFYGKLSDRFRKITLVKIGYVVGILGIAAAAVWQNEFGFAAASVLIGMATISETSAFSYICETGKRIGDMPKFVTLKEVSNVIGRLVPYVFVLLLGFEFSLWICIAFASLIIIFIKIKD